MSKKQKKDQIKELEHLSMYREYKVVKANALVQKSRFNLTMQEQKIILYLISKIKPQDMELEEHIFQIKDFCKLCGLDSDSGANYSYIKKTLKGLRDKSIWVTLDDGYESTLSWMDYVKLGIKSGAVIIKISNMMKPYLLELQQHFTQYEILYILAMKSQYSIRLYELLKSYEYKHKLIINIDDLKRKLFAEKYDRFPDFRRKVLDISMREINELSDIFVDYTPIKESRSYAKIEFTIKLKKNINDRLEAWQKIDEVINPAQISLVDEKPTILEEMETK